MTLESALERAFAECAAARPAIALSRELFVSHLRERLAPGRSDESLASLHVADLHLACACLHGIEAAWKELDREHLSRIPQFVARIDASPSFADDVRQRLCAKLVTTSEAPGRLSLYTGRGPLGAWLRVAAIREAQSAKRRSKKTVDADDVALAAPGHDPEVELLKRRFAKEFAEAFESVLPTLTADERNVLRLHYLDGLSIEAVGTTYRVSRATAARWIASARATIVERTQAALAARLGDSAPSPLSILAFVKSQLDLSLVRHFEE